MNATRDRPASPRIGSGFVHQRDAESVIGATHVVPCPGVERPDRQDVGNRHDRGLGATKDTFRLNSTIEL